MAPVAALIVIRPCIEVNAIEGDSLNADAQGEDARSHFAVEAVLVHAEVSGGVAHAEEAGHGRHARGGGCRRLRDAVAATRLAGGCG